MTNYEHAKMIDIIAKMDSPLLKVHSERCMLVRNRNASCLRCAKVCTSGAISLTDKGIEVDPSLCIGCGTCASACPTCCLEAANPTDEELFSQIEHRSGENSRTVAIACENALDCACGEAGGSRLRVWKLGDESGNDADSGNGNGNDGNDGNGTRIIQVVCLGRAEESFLVEAVAHGAKNVTLISGNCEQCAHRASIALCNEIRESANNLLESMGFLPVVSHINVRDAALTSSLLPPDGKDAPQEENEGAGASVDAHKSENASAGVCTYAGVNASASIGAENMSQHVSLRCSTSTRTALKPGANKGFTSKFAHVQADGTLPHFLPQRRLRLFNSMKHLGKPKKESVTTRLWGQVSINTDLCRSCRMCTVFCPTGAIARFDAKDGAFGVEHRSTLCVQCRMCETICPEQAISVSDTVSLREFLSGKKVRFTMKPIGWNPGGDTSIATRMAHLMKTDTFQDPQAKVKPEEISRQRNYALERDRRRKEIRAQQNNGKKSSSE